jgi:hypothetical protein
LRSTLVALLALASLFIWQNAFSLLPYVRPLEEEITASDGLSSLGRLLRRSVRPEDLVRTCMVEWKTHFLKKGTGNSAKIEEAEKAYEKFARRKASTETIVESYNHIAKSIKERKT